MTSQARKDFEREWNKVSGRTPERSIAMDGQNSYENRIDDAAWWGWQASRAAIEVELPPIWEQGANSALGQACAQIRTADVQAIKSLGLRVKP